MAGYLFVHFTGEEKDGEQVYFAQSKDGLQWKDLNGGKPVLLSGIGEQGVRDPFLVKDETTGRYYIIATDLRIEAGKGWESAKTSGSPAIIVWESEDLIHWSEASGIRTGLEGAGCVWAPEAIYDEERRAFLLFWSSYVKDEGEIEAKFRIYAAYTKDFREFSIPFKYVERETDVIDMTIVCSHDKYYRFLKDELSGKVFMEYGSRLDGEFKRIHSEMLDTLEGVEGPECYLLPDGKRWCLIVDRFAKGEGYLPLVTDNLDSGVFHILHKNEYDMGKNQKRHGGILRLSDEEYKRIAVL